MPTLSDRLKSMGVRVGTAGQASRPSPSADPDASRWPFSVEQVIPGQVRQTERGETYVVEAHYPAAFRQGKVCLQLTASLNTMATWAGEQKLCECAPESFAFIDTETTGLMGGSGVYAFLVGVGRFEGDDFHLAQFFMRDPFEESAQLAALEEFLAPCQAIVTFNGKSFDVPILNTRFVTHGWPPPLNGAAHVDLLHLARRLWRDRLPSRRLGNLEIEILGVARAEEDVPGFLIPQMYFDYLRDHDARPLQGVFYHNAMDVVSMAALFNHMAGLLEDPLQAGIEHIVDLIALAKLYEDLDDLDRATGLYIHALEHADTQAGLVPRLSILEAIERLAAIHKRQDNYPAAVPLWEQAARYQHLQAHIELAKFYEHRQRDPAEAIAWTQSAINLVQSSGFSGFERRQWLAELVHRLERLQRKQQG